MESLYSWLDCSFLASSWTKWYSWISSLMLGRMLSIVTLHCVGWSVIFRGTNEYFCWCVLCTLYCKNNESNVEIEPLEHLSFLSSGPRMNGLVRVGESVLLLFSTRRIHQKTNKIQTKSIWKRYDETMWDWEYVIVTPFIIVFESRCVSYNLFPWMGFNNCHSWRYPSSLSPLSNVIYIFLR